MTAVERIEDLKQELRDLELEEGQLDDEYRDALLHLDSIRAMLVYGLSNSPENSLDLFVTDKGEVRVTFDLDYLMEDMVDTVVKTAENLKEAYQEVIHNRSQQNEVKFKIETDSIY